MKKALLVVSMIALALAACAKKEESPPQHKVAAPAVAEQTITNQFEYNATERIRVAVTEFESFGKKCVSVHANQIYDTSQADVSCIDRLNEPLVAHDKNEVLKQFTYKAGGTPVQVTIVKTKQNHVCTIVHANYIHDTSSASISC